MGVAAAVVDGGGCEGDCFGMTFVPLDAHSSRPASSVRSVSSSTGAAAAAIIVGALLSATSGSTAAPFGFGGGGGG